MGTPKTVTSKKMGRFMNENLFNLFLQPRSFSMIPMYPVTSGFLDSMLPHSTLPSFPKSTFTTVLGGEAKMP